MAPLPTQHGASILVDHSAGQRRGPSKAAQRRKTATPGRGPLPNHEELLGKIQRQFERLEDELDVLEATMIHTGWMPDPEERKAARAAAKVAQAAQAAQAARVENSHIESADVDGAEPSGPLPVETEKRQSLPRKPR